MEWNGERESSLAQPHPPNPTRETACLPQLSQTDIPQSADHPTQDEIEGCNLASWKKIYPLGDSLSTVKKKSFNPGGDPA